MAVAGTLFSLLYFGYLTGWVADTADYKLLINAKGNIDNLTITNYIYFFNASTGIIAKPEGVQVNTFASSTGNFSRIEIVFLHLGNGLAIVTLSDMKPLSNVPASSIPTDTSSQSFFSNGIPGVQGNVDNCTNLFLHLSVSAKTRFGELSVYSQSAESVPINGNFQWDNSQSKDRVFSVAVFGFALLSVALSWACVTIVSFLWTRARALTFRPFPIITLCFASLMCLLYVYVGVGDDLLSHENLGAWSRVVLALVSPLFHFNYLHLMDNLLYSFIIGGSLVEVWLYKSYSSKRYAWYFSPVPLSLLFSFLFSFPILPIVSSYGISSGSSLWCIGLAVVLVLAIYRERTRLLTLSSFSNLIVLFLVGYLLFSSSWNYVANALVTYYSTDVWGTLMIHGVFGVLYAAFASIAPSLRSQARKLIGFFDR